MKTRLYFLLLILMIAAGTGAAAGEAAVRRSFPPEAEKVTRQFLHAFARNDRDAITAMLPRRLENLYGPSPFVRMPSLFKPRADGRTGAIEFQGGRSEAAFPDKGVIVLRRVSEGGRRTWRIRQIYWYEELPPEARQIPNKSKTSADRAEEPRLRQAAMELLHDWMEGDFKKLDERVFHWWEVDRDPPKWVTMKGVDLRRPTESLGGLRVAFTANLRLPLALSKEVEGSVWLVEEEGRWRVRPLTLAFWF